MALPITVPYTFGNATTAIPLSNLDSDYATVYQAVNGIGNGSVALANVTITGGTVSNVSGVVPTPFTANGVVYASSTSALATGSALTFNGSATTPLVKVAGTSTNASSQDFTTNSAAQRTTIGVEQSAGGGLFSGSSAYAAVFGSAGASNTQFATNNTVQMTLDTSGNLGLGVTPFTWASGWKAFQIGAYGNFSALSNQINLSTNAYYSAASSWIYQNTNPATNYAQVGGQHIWQNAASGTATNAISFINAMTLDASGNLIVGGTSALGNTTNRGNITLNGTSSALYSLGVGGVLKGFLNHGGTNLELQNTANGILSFSTNATEAMRIDSSGNLLVGTTSATVSGTGQFYATSNVNGWYGGTFINNNTTGPYGILVQMASASGPNYLAIFRYGGTNQCLINFNGNIVNTNNSYGAISDVKLKENIVDATPKLADLMQVKVRSYNLKSDPTHKQLGVVAQELEQVFPSMVEESKDKDEENNDLGTTTKTVKYSVFVPMLIKAMQEQQVLITAQQSTIQSLTERITVLENK